MTFHYQQISDDRFAPVRPARARHAAAWAGSIAAHALAALAIVFLSPRFERPHHRWIVAYLADLGEQGGARPRGNGGRIEALPAAGPARSAKPLPTKAAVRNKARARHFRVVPALAGEKTPPGRDPTPVPQSQAFPRRFGSFADRSLSPGAVASNRNSEPQTGGAGGSDPGSNRGIPNGVTGGSGDAAQGTGTGAQTISAHADYGRNPLPPYPSAAHRRAQQGTVTLRVLIGADGGVKQVKVQKSSGVDSLDDAALETVRTRWRFVPARRDGIAVESWVVVPIRFTLTDVSAN